MDVTTPEQARISFFVCSSLVDYMASDISH